MMDWNGLAGDGYDKQYRVNHGQDPFSLWRGEGRHHDAFEVTEIRAELYRLKDERFRLLNEEPTTVADSSENISECQIGHFEVEC